MTKTHWWFLGIAAALAVVIWYFFLRRGAPHPVRPGTTAAEANQDQIVGSSRVEPEKGDAAVGYFQLNLGGLYP